MQHATISPSQGLILVSAADRGRLTSLARACLERSPDIAEELLAEMDRARIAAAAAMPDDVVRMGSTITIRGGEGNIQRITLVYPSEADIAESKISVLTPLGTALIGAAAGHVVNWRSRDGRELSATIDAIDTPLSGQQPRSGRLS